MTTTPTTTPTTAPTTGTLAVPGATLYYERRGTGPVLLLVPGGGADAGLFAGMAPALAATGRTVVSYDPRGQSRSTLDGPAADQRVADWADDARRILDLVSPGEPADVLGCSAGAVAALGLLARHPERVRRVVAHEPPLVEVLPDPAPHRALFAEVRELTRTQGPAAGMAHMAQGLGGTPERQEPAELPPEILEMAPRMYANQPFFLEHVLVPFTSATPDVPALRTAADRLVLAAGEDSRAIPALYGPAARLSALTGAPFTEFPGGHVGCAEHPAPFATRLLETLTRKDRMTPWMSSVPQPRPG
ncbi:pimeloyl-ACP methyl ester carboxylesterase [Streptomyces sp. 3211.6]|uniref:alpha/beta fold hydrolase n=1 Tax=Streptomyces sp. 3211.6 TaxID=1938845 RepID=UPI000EB54DC1|nr:alpha/beta fold hydrolase [Streptomyces sp. 3211.6]RKS97147.1 pimeloyl-ACP methyl ester carboxylesterase [Streptomyces sp. 3211.6]